MTEAERETIVRAFIASWNARDRDAIGRAMHPDIECTGASYPTALGREAALALCDPFLAADGIEWIITNCATRGSLVFAERVDKFRFADRPDFVVAACGVFDVGADGLIRRWQDYFDSAGIAEAFEIS